MKSTMKKIFMATMMVAMVLGMSTVSYASEGWKLNSVGWWYATNDAETTWYANEWQWIDGNKDGIAECYCFDSNGYMYADCVTPDGYTVDANGAWIEDGKVQTKEVPVDGGSGSGTGSSSSTGSTASGSSASTGSSSNTAINESTDTIEYDEFGISKVALDMYNSTMEENEKYGVVDSWDGNYSLGPAIFVTYGNGFKAIYYVSERYSYGGRPYSLSYSGNSPEQFIKGADNSMTSNDERVALLQENGLVKARVYSQNTAQLHNSNYEFRWSYTSDGHHSIGISRD